MMMYRMQLTLLFLLLSVSASNGVPFRTARGANEDEKEEESSKLRDAIIENGHIRYMTTAASSSSGPARRNPIVESFFANGSSHSEELRQDIEKRATQLQDFLVSTRRALHQHPELMYNEKETSAHVQNVLRELDIPFTTGWAVNTVPDVIPGGGGFGVVADIGTGGPPCVLLRADMDALPIVERTEGVDDFRSTKEGKMHACGHDGHTTMLLGAASILKEMEDSINGTVRLMFQPAEEGGAGGKRMREEGVLTQEPKVQQAYGMHLWPTIPSGVVASRPGPILAACERFEILIAGVGGHAAMPHLTVDPIVTASSIIMNLQTLVSRNLSPLESGVCSITKFEAGDAFNIIPASALLRGTIRALSTETLLSLKERVHHVVESTAGVYGCNVTITYSPDFYPPTVNDPDLFENFSKDVGALVAEDGQVMDIEPTMGAEDFSFVAENVPSTFFLLGQGSGQNPPSNYGLHHPHFAIDEAVLPRGVSLHVNLALRSLQKLREEAKAAPA
jgi:amidohydrolase